ncbi:copper resistance CopC family protein [Isoptericola sp. NPDC057191]|uniref:copper resistance CopC family protein n=1 Tax=Isoptericola sp. NPDC057191 TaxID=3346041 RepID=UPI0036453D12
MTPRGRDARRGGARRTLLAGIGALGLALAGAVGAAAPASAHNVVVGSTPEAGSTVTQAPDSVDITFDDVVLNLSADGSSTVVSVTDPAGAERATGCPTTQDRTVSVPVSLGPAGTYTVDWRIVSADGHPTSGKFSFTYDPPAGSSPADPASPAAGSAACGASAAQPDGQDAGAGTGADEGGASDLVVVLGIAGGVVVLAGAAVLVALRVARRRG